VCDTQENVATSPGSVESLVTGNLRHYNETTYRATLNEDCLYSFSLLPPLRMFFIGDSFVLCHCVVENMFMEIVTGNV